MTIRLLHAHGYYWIEESRPMGIWRTILMGASREIVLAAAKEKGLDLTTISSDEPVTVPHLSDLSNTK